MIFYSAFYNDESENIKMYFEYWETLYYEITWNILKSSSR